MLSLSNRIWIAASVVVVAGLADCAYAQDCNGNGIPDDEDIANGTSEDCNDNGVPDECEDFATHTLDGDFDGAISVYAADVDGDGDLDILGAAHGDDAITWWENAAGDGTVWTEHTVDGSFDGARSVYAADVDGDGDLDILGAAQIADDITWWENTAGDGTVWFEHTVNGGFDGARSVYAADVDDDGDMDILGAAWLADEITWWENAAGDGSVWIEHTVDGSFDGARSVYAADFDDDGDMDIVGAAWDYPITWWENTAGDGMVWTKHIVDVTFSTPTSIYAADVDGDGDMDILAAGWLADEIHWWENAAGNGIAWTVHHVVDGGFEGARSVYAADVDGDGDLDVLGAADLDDDITWWENTAGDGTVWFEHTVDGNFDGAHSAYAADIDGDGDVDILGGATVADDITWWENLLVCVPGCPWDVTDDGLVGTSDLLFLLGWWGGDPYGPPDFNGDGVVDTADLIELLGNWGPCPK